jgi:hypothetical protein
MTLYMGNASGDVLLPAKVYRSTQAWHFESRSVRFSLHKPSSD